MEEKEMSKVRLESLELIKSLIGTEYKEKNFELLFHFTNDSHYSVGFNSGESLKDTVYKLHEMFVELNNNYLFKE